MATQKQKREMQSMKRIERRFGINADCLKGISERDALALIKNAGFESVFLSSYHDQEVESIKKEADRLGLEVEFIHAPFKGINTIWQSGMEYLTIFEQMKETRNALVFENKTQGGKKTLAELFNSK